MKKGLLIGSSILLILGSTSIDIVLTDEKMIVKEKIVERVLEWVVEVEELPAEPELPVEPEELTSLRKGKWYNGLPLFSTQDIQRPKGSKNIGADTNNPGNLMEGRGKGAIGVYKSPNGRYYSVFATMQQGYEALLHEIEIRKETTHPSRLSLTAFLWGWVLGKNGTLDKNSYYYHYALARVGKDVDITTLSTELLAEIIMEGEATTKAYKNGGKDLSHLVPNEQFILY